MKHISYLLIALTALLISGCNTVEGMGRDIRAGGSAIEKAAH